MRTNYILIDFENVQPANLEMLRGHDFKVKVFVGANQKKITLDLATTMHALGENAEYIQVQGNGPNALDFHIAFYMGEIAARDPDCYFHVISKDTGFDPLIRHLKSRKVLSRRHQNIGEIPLLKAADPNARSEVLKLIIQNLHGRKDSRPKALSTLSNSINSLFGRIYSEEELLNLIEALAERHVLTIKGNGVVYHFPD